MSSLKPLRVSALPVVLVSLLATSCLTPPPSQVGSPDQELESLLVELHDVRGGTFEREQGLGDASAAREGRITRDLQRLALLYPRHVPVLVSNASVAYERGDSIGAQKYLDQALSVDPAHTHATLLRVRIAAEAGNLPYARRVLNDQLELAPDNPELHEALGGVLYLTGDYDDALLELEIADSLRAEARAARAAEEQGSEEGAGGDHQDATDADEDTLYVTYYHRGLIAEAEGDLEGARELYQLSQDENPHFEPAARRLKWLEARAEQEDIED